MNIIAIRSGKMMINVRIKKTGQSAPFLKSFDLLSDDRSIEQWTQFINSVPFSWG